MALNLIPTAGQTLLVTRQPIYDNFVTINDAFKVNHIEYGLAGAGKHKFVTLPYQSVAPTTGAAEMALYSSAGILYLRPQNNGTAINIGGTGTTTVNYTILPNGLLLKWGSFLSTSGSNPKTYVIPSTGAFGPLYTNLYNVQLTAGQRFVSPNVFNDFAVDLDVNTSKGAGVNTITFAGFQTGSTNHANGYVSFFCIGV